MGIFSNLKDWFVMINMHPNRYMDNYFSSLHREIQKINPLMEDFNNFRDQFYRNNKKIFDEINNLTNAYIEPKLKPLEDMPDYLGSIHRDILVQGGRIESLTQLHNEDHRLFDLEIKRLRKRIRALETKKKNKEPKVTNNPGS